MCDTGGMPTTVRLGAADYELVVPGTRDLFTFCMCAGGFVIPSVSERELYGTNGMSYSVHDSPFANSGLVMTIDPREYGEGLMAGIELHWSCERAAFEIGRGTYQAPIQWSADFLGGRPSRGRLPSSHRRGTVATDLSPLAAPGSCSVAHGGPAVFGPPLAWVVPSQRDVGRPRVAWQFARFGSCVMPGHFSHRR